MKVIVIGAGGTIGSVVAEQLAARHEVIRVGKASGQYQTDIADIGSVQKLFDQAGRADAVVVAAGDVHFGLLSEMTPEQFQVGLQHKVMGQVNVALVAQKYLNDGGSITLTTGIVNHEPIRYGVNASTANAAIEGFVRAAAIELPRGLRINAVSPTILTESLDSYGPYFYGFETVPASRVAQAYVKSVEGLHTGRLYTVW
ncbi:MAG TPA: short chain dehydrogenase [Noviherbaspirillum sp.]|nr:short chain dehydrogenase [Noviherbaspirillum sp.]